MTNKELNRDINRLHILVQKLCNDDKIQVNDYYMKVTSDVKPEFKRLYNADQRFKYMNRKSVLIMLRLNLKYRIISFHQFGMFIEL